MRSYAVIPPLMLDSRQRRLVFNNENGALIDMETEFKVRKTSKISRFFSRATTMREIYREMFFLRMKYLTGNVKGLWRYNFGFRSLPKKSFFRSKSINKI